MNCYIIVGKKNKKLKSLDDLGLIGLEALISYDYELLEGILSDNEIENCKVIEVSIDELGNYVWTASLSARLSSPDELRPFV